MEDERNVNLRKVVEKLVEQNPSLDEKTIEKAVETMFDEMSMALICGDRVELRGFCSLVVRKRAGGEKRNPKRNIKVQVSDRGSLYFRASKKLIEALNTTSANDNITHPRAS